MNCRKRGQKPSGCTAPQHLGRCGLLCSSAPYGQPRKQDEASWGRTETLSKPWLPLSFQRSCYCPAVWVTIRHHWPGDGERGMAPPPSCSSCLHVYLSGLTWQTQPSSILACCPLPAQALHRGQRQLKRWQGHVQEPLLPLVTP